MAFALSPGVNVSEIDLTTIVPSVATSIGAFAGKFAWGPVNEIVTISDEIRLVDRFGLPNSTNSEYWFSAANFLSYSNTLRVVRAANTATTFNATANGTSVLIENEDDYLANHSSGATTHLEFAAKYPGDLGNSLRVEVADSVTYSSWDLRSLFTDQPATSDYANSVGGADDELHIVVIDEDGKISGTANTVLETFAFASKASDAKNPDGTTNFYKDVINNRSRYIWWLAHPEAGTNWGTTAAGKEYTTLIETVVRSLSGGADGSITDGDLMQAYDRFCKCWCRRCKSDHFGSSKSNYCNTPHWWNRRNS